MIHQLIFLEAIDSLVYGDPGNARLLKNWLKFYFRYRSRLWTCNEAICRAGWLFFPNESHPIWFWKINNKSNVSFDSFATGISSYSWWVFSILITDSMLNWIKAHFNTYRVALLDISRYLQDCPFRMSVCTTIFKRIAGLTFYPKPLLLSGCLQGSKVVKSSKIWEVVKKGSK